MVKSVKPKRRGSASARIGVKSVNLPRLSKSTTRQDKEEAKKEAQARQPLPGSFSLTWHVLNTLKKFWKPLGGIVLVYAILNVIFASGLLSTISANVSDIKNNVNNTSGTTHVNKAINGFGTLLTGTNSSGSGSVMQSLLLVIGSLVIIWALRQLLAGETITIKQAYYHSMAPLIPFLLIIFVIIVQLLPLTLGSALLAIILSSTINSGAFLSVVFSLVFVGMVAWSIYMVSGSIFALYIVTLPDMQPVKALRSAKSLVHYRRWSIMRKIMFLPLFVLVLMGAIVIPLIALAPFLVTAVFFALGVLAILFIHAYFYSLYRELLA